MSEDAIKIITDAESAAREAKAAAERRAVETVEECRRNGEAKVAEARAKADRDVRDLLERTDAENGDARLAVFSDTQSVCTALRNEAEPKLDQAATLIVERIVKKK